MGAFAKLRVKQAKIDGLWAAIPRGADLVCGQLPATSIFMPAASTSWTCT